MLAWSCWEAVPGPLSVWFSGRGWSASVGWSTSHPIMRNQDDPWKNKAGLQRTTAQVTSNLYCLFHLLAAVKLRKFELRHHNVTNTHIETKIVCRCLSLRTFLCIGFKSVANPRYPENNLPWLLPAMLLDVTQLDESCFGTIFAWEEKLKKKENIIWLVCCLSASDCVHHHVTQRVPPRPPVITRGHCWKPWVIVIQKVTSEGAEHTVSCRDGGCEWREESGGGSDAEGAEEEIGSIYRATTYGLLAKRAPSATLLQRVFHWNDLGAACPLAVTLMQH